MDAERVAELRALCDAATPGEWGVPYGVEDEDEGQGPFVSVFGAVGQGMRECAVAYCVPLGRPIARVEADAAFIAAARSALPELLDRVDTLETALARLVADQDIHPLSGWCRVCRAEESGKDGRLVHHDDCSFVNASAVLGRPARRSAK